MKCPHCDGTGTLALEAVTVGDMIMAMRKGKKLTQEDLARRVSLSRAQIANLEVGRSDMPLKTLKRFASALECSMRDLIPE